MMRSLDRLSVLNGVLSQYCNCSWLAGYGVVIGELSQSDKRELYIVGHLEKARLS